MMNSGAPGVKGHFAGRSINMTKTNGAVFANDGNLVYFDVISSTFGKLDF